MRYILKLLILVNLGILQFSESAIAADKSCIDQVCFDPTSSQLAPAPMVGTALFRYWGFRVYVAALYASPIEAKSSNILQLPEIELVIHYLRDFTAEDFKVSGRDILEDNPHIDLKKFSGCLDKMDSLYLPVNIGDRYSIVKRDNSGLSLSLNGKLLGTVCDAEFASVYLSIWLSRAHGIGAKFQRELTGINSELTDIGECTHVDA